jgi:FkbM family methyltransferase
MSEMIDQLKSKGLIHVGANYAQEGEQYECMGLKVIWIEALVQFESDGIDRLADRVASFKSQELIYELLTDKDNQEYTFNISNNQGASSSILELAAHKEIWPQVHYSDTKQLKSKRLDSVIEEYNITAKDYTGLVMDTQGSELMILQGASKYLKTCEEIIIEVPNFNSYKDCPQVSHFDDHLSKEGFEQTNKVCFAANGDKEYYDILYTKV